jgi:hypothetical protein
MFLTPHKFARHKQLPALRNLTPGEREVVLLLGSDVRPAQGQLLINYDEKVRRGVEPRPRRRAFWGPGDARRGSRPCSTQRRPIRPGGSLCPAPGARASPPPPPPRTPPGPPVLLRAGGRGRAGAQQHHAAARWRGRVFGESAMPAAAAAASAPQFLKCEGSDGKPAAPASSGRHSVQCLPLLPPFGASADPPPPRPGLPPRRQGEAALFEDIKAKDEDGSTTFTTAARVVSETTHVLALDIRWAEEGAASAPAVTREGELIGLRRACGLFATPPGAPSPRLRPCPAPLPSQSPSDLYPLVYHEHPGATAIVQRLGRIMVGHGPQGACARGCASTGEGGLGASALLACLTPGPSSPPRTALTPDCPRPPPPARLPSSSASSRPRSACSPSSPARRRSPPRACA